MILRLTLGIALGIKIAVDSFLSWHTVLILSFTLAVQLVDTPIGRALAKGLFAGALAFFWKHVMQRDLPEEILPEPKGYVIRRTSVRRAAK